VNKPVPVENIALDASASHISRRSQILVDVLATQTNPRSSRKRDMSMENLEINLISETPPLALTDGRNARPFFHSTPWSRSRLDDWARALEDRPRHLYLLTGDLTCRQGLTGSRGSTISCLPILSSSRAKPEKRRRRRKLRRWLDGARHGASKLTPRYGDHFARHSRDRYWRERAENLPWTWHVPRPDLAE
jgi:hypothetical protein